jgi:inosine-uridine nucleoside N-ribohydrolase
MTSTFFFTAACVATANINLIIDTDLSIDVDDVGAVCLAHALADRGEVNLLAIVHDSGANLGVGALSAINEYYGRSLRLGAYRGPIGAPNGSERPEWTNRGRGQYIESLVDEFEPPVRSAADVDDTLRVYRDTLAAAPDGSVTIAAIGFATALLELLESSGDTSSPLNGTELLQRKVRRVAMMGGRHHYDSTRDPVEWNFGGCDRGSIWNGGARTVGWVIERRIRSRMLLRWRQYKRESLQLAVPSSLAPSVPPQN